MSSGALRKYIPASIGIATCCVFLPYAYWWAIEKGPGVITALDGPFGTGGPDRFLVRCSCAGANFKAIEEMMAERASS